MISAPSTGGIDLIALNEGTISSIGLVNVSISGDHDSAGLVGGNAAGGLVQDCFVTGSVTGAANAINGYS